MSSTTGLAEPTPTAESSSTGKGLGAIQITLLSMAAAAPLAVVAGSAASIAFANGAGTPLNFIVLGLILLVFCVGYMAMLARTRTNGGFFDLITRGLGPAWATGGAYAAVVLYASFGVASGGFFGIALEGALGAVGIVGPPWWVYGLAGLAVVALLTFLKVQVSAKIVGLIVLLELLVVTVVSIAIVAGGGAGGEGIGFSSFTIGAFGSGSIALGLAMNAGAFVGFEGTTMFRRDAKDPDKTVPRATYATIISIGLLYAIGVWLVVEAWGPGEVPGIATELGVALYSATAAEFVGVWLALLVGLLLCTSIIASNTITNTLAARYLQTLGRHALLPKALAGGSSERAHPYLAITVMTIFMFGFNILWIVTGTDPLLILGLATSFAGVCLMMILLLVSISVIVYFRRNPTGDSAWKTLIAPLLSAILLAGLAVLVMMNLELLTGIPNPAVNLAVAVSPVVLMVVGILVGSRRARRGGIADFDLDVDAEHDVKI